MKRRIVMRATATLGVALLCVTGAHAHHSFAMFDKNKEVVIHGTVKAFQYTNPHSWLQVNAIDDKGVVKEWSFEMEGPSTLMRAGIKRGSLVPGEKITVKGWPMRDGRPAGAIINITKENGTVLNPRGGFAIPGTPPAGAAAPATAAPKTK